MGRFLLYLYDLLKMNSNRTQKDENLYCVVSEAGRSENVYHRLGFHLYINTTYDNRVVRYFSKTDYTRIVDNCTLYINNKVAVCFNFTVLQQDIYVRGKSSLTKFTGIINEY